MHNRVCPTSDEMIQIGQLIKSDKMLTAYELVKKIGPLDDWQFGEPLKKASILASRLGDSRKSDAYDYLNYRNDRKDLKRFLRYQYIRLSNAPTIQILREVSDVIDLRKGEMDETLYVNFLLFKTWLLATLRDFSRAHLLIKEAKTIRPDYSWLYTEEADVLEKEDRYEAALDSANHAISLEPLYHNANLKKEVLLFHLNRDEEAIEMLEHMHQCTEHKTYASRLQYRYSEQGEHDKALWALDEYQRLSPLLTKESKQWVETRKADFLYQKGELETALKVYENSQNGFHKSISKNLKRPNALELPSKKLDVSFVRQYNMTCAPATLAALSAYYGKERNHEEIANAICYDGTPWHKERTWAEQNDFQVFEFKLNEEILIELTEKDLPFTLSTRAVTSAHLQACIGYDARSKIVFLRDPTERHYGEILLDGLVEDHPVSGPRGMLILPKDQAYKVSDTFFPDQHIYNARHELMLALDKHDSLKVDEAIATMRAINDTHPLVIESEIIVASYKGNFSKCHELNKELHERFPEIQSLALSYLNSSMNHCSRDEQLAIALTAIKMSNPDPVFYAELGDLYMEDLRDLSQAEYYLKKSALYTFSNARSLASLATCAQRKKQDELALEYRRFASCKNISNESYAHHYFKLALNCGKEDEAIEYLKQRVTENGTKDSAPWITLSGAYESMYQDSEARQVILKALEVLPNDSALLLKIINRSHSWGYEDKVDNYLEKVKNHCSSIEWNYTAGSHAEFIGNRTRALRHFKYVLDENPTHYGALNRYASLLEDEFGVDFAIDFLSQTAEKHSQSFLVIECYSSFLATRQHPKLLSALESLIKLEPNNLWANRELALLKENTGEVDQAIKIAREILSKQPNNEESIGVLGGILASNNQEEEAKELFKKALSLNVNYIYPLDQWISIQSDNESILKVLKFYKTELYKQTASGDAIKAYRNHAFKYIEPEELLKELKHFRKTHHYEWEARIEEKEHLLDMNLPKEAETLILNSIDQFPHIPRLYAELASVYQHLGDNKKHVENLEKTLTMSPSWDWCARELSEAYELIGDYKNAASTIQKAIKWSPLDPRNHGCYAEFLIRINKNEEALTALEQAVTANPLYNWGWGKITYLAKELKQEQTVYDLIELHDKNRIKLSTWWETKFDIYDQLDEALALEHCETGIKLFPKESVVYDSKAYLLARIGKVDAALEATQPEILGEEIPTILKGRRADILYENNMEEEALKLMETTVKSSPDYLYGIKKLTNWYQAKENYTKMKESALSWLRYDPRSHIARGYLGQYYEINNKLKEASEQYQQAFRINPQYSFAGYRGFELAIKSDELDGIPQIISLTRHYGNDSEAIEMETRYLHKQGKVEEAFQSFLKLLECPKVNIEEVGKTVDLFGKKGRTTLIQYVESGKSSNQQLLTAWLWGRDNYLKTASQIEALPYDSSLKVELWVSFLSWMEKDADRAVVLKFYKKHRNVADLSVHLWGDIGSLLLTRKLYKEAYNLLSNYEEKKGAEEWMIANHAIASGHIKPLESVEDSLKYGLTQANPSNGKNYLLLMLAPIEAAKGNIKEAQRLISDSSSHLSIKLTSYIKLTNLIIQASEGAQKSELKKTWKEFQANCPEWKTDILAMKYVSLTKKAVLSHGAKWPGLPLIAVKLLNKQI